MKKTFKNIRTLAALLIASAAFSACSNEDSAIIGEQPASEQQAPQVYTLTIDASMDGGAQTRALELDGTKLVAKWANDETVDVRFGSTLLGTLTVSNVSADGKTCTLSGTLTGTIRKEDKLYFYYNYSGTLVNESQTGTLASTAGSDYAMTPVTVKSVEGGNITLESEPSFQTQVAVLKITMQDALTNKLNATSLQITIGDIAPYTFSPTAATYTANGDGVVYFALPSASRLSADSGTSLDVAGLAAASVTFTATVGADTYTVTKTGYAFAAGKYYATTLTMAKPAPVYTLLSAATTSDYGKVVCADGHLHDAKTAVPAGCTAVGILGKVTETGCGLILALKDATSQNWNTINGWTSTTTYAGTTLKVLPDAAAHGSLTSYTRLGTTAVSDWAVAQKSDYEAIFTNLGSTTGNSNGTTYDGNVNAYITTGVGGTALDGNYWSATEKDSGNALAFISSLWGLSEKTNSLSVRPVLGFGPAKLLSAATTSDVGKVVCADGHLRDAKTAVPAGGTAVGILGKVTETGHGLILALQDATSQKWNTINGWTSETTYAGTTLKVLPNDAARGANLTSYTTLGSTAVSNWAVAQKSDYEAIFTNLGSTTGNSNGKTYDANVNAYITTGVGGTALPDYYYYWSATAFDGDCAWNFRSDIWGGSLKTYSDAVRPVLGF